MMLATGPFVPTAEEATDSPACLVKGAELQCQLVTMGPILLGNFLAVPLGSHKSRKPSSVMLEHPGMGGARKKRGFTFKLTHKYPRAAVLECFITESS